MPQSRQAPNADGNQITFPGANGVNQPAHQDKTEGIGNHKNTVDNPALFFRPANALLKFRSQDSWQTDTPTFNAGQLSRLAS